MTSYISQEKTEAQRGLGTCPKGTAEPRFEPHVSFMVTRAWFV